MKKALKRGVERCAGALVRAASATAAGRYVFDQVLRANMQRTARVTHTGVDLVFAVPNAVSLARATTFSTKEPETLDWIDGMEPDAVLWDIGANVGIYSCYAARRRSCRVYAFEPSIFNLELLGRNVFLNGLTEQVTIVPLPLTAALITSTLNMSMTEWGGALSTFGESYTYDGTPLNRVFAFQTIGLSMDDAVTRLEIAPPQYIKMDVDGIEHLILQGGPSVLANVRSVLMEASEDGTHAAEAHRLLGAAGLELVGTRQSDMFDGTSVFNQIWRRAS